MKKSLTRPFTTDDINGLQITGGVEFSTQGAFRITSVNGIPSWLYYLKERVAGFLTRLADRIG